MSFDCTHGELLKSDFWSGLPALNEICFLGVHNKVVSYQVTTVTKSCLWLVITVIRRDERMFWESGRDLLDRAVVQAATALRGQFIFDLILFDVLKEMKTFDFQELAQMLSNTAVTLGMGQKALIKYSSMYGILQKLGEESWGKITFRTSVQISTDNPSFLCQSASAVLKDVAAKSVPVVMLINDLSSVPLFNPDDEVGVSLWEKFKKKEQKKGIMFPRKVILRGGRQWLTIMQ